MIHIFSVFFRNVHDPIRIALHLYSLFITLNAAKELLCFLFLILNNGCYLRYNADIAYELRLKYEFQVIDMAIQILIFYSKRKNTAASFYLTYLDTLLLFIVYRCIFHSIE